MRGAWRCLRSGSSCDALISLGRVRRRQLTLAVAVLRGLRARNRPIGALRLPVLARLVDPLPDALGALLHVRELSLGGGGRLLVIVAHGSSPTRSSDSARSSSFSRR